jgi:hypothetical protein
MNALAVRKSSQKFARIHQTFVSEPFKIDSNRKKTCEKRGWLAAFF